MVVEIVNPPSGRPGPTPESKDSDDTADVDVNPLVLIVDDTDDTRALYALAFSEPGYRVEEAADGLEALDSISAFTRAS